MMSIIPFGLLMMSATTSSLMPMTMLYTTPSSLTLMPTTKPCRP